MTRVFAALLTFFAGVAIADGEANHPPPPPSEQLAVLRDRQLNALNLRPWHDGHIRGKGVRVAILDSGFRGYRAHLGNALPNEVLTRSFRVDGNLEGKDSQHGILCAEVVHAIAPDADILLANWEPDDAPSFLRAVKWARDQGAGVLSCSVIMPGWSDGRGGGPVHAELASIVGDGTDPRGMVCVASAGNIAQRHWSGAFRDIGDGWHGWAGMRRDNHITPWDHTSVSVELTSIESSFELFVIEDGTDRSVGERYSLAGGGTSVRFQPAEGRGYAVRVRQKGSGGSFRVVVLGAGVEFSTPAGSVSFPADGRAMLAVGAVNAEGRRSGYSSCGPGVVCPKPDFVAQVPFTSRWRPQPFSGTSAAAPQAAGLAALWRSAHRDWSPNRVTGAMRQACRDLAAPGHDTETGFGILAMPAP